MRISDKAKRYLEKLRSIGVNVIADHFGEGASTIQSLFVLPVDAVKLSEDLVRKATSNSDKKARFVVDGQDGTFTGLKNHSNRGG